MIDQTSRFLDHFQSSKIYCKITPFLSCFKIIILKKIKICHLLIMSQNFKHAVK